MHLVNDAQRMQHEEYLAKEIVDCCYKVHSQLGPGLLERVHEVCFCHELTKKGIPWQRQLDLPIQYDGLIFDEALRLDVLVDELVICELKAKDQLNPGVGSSNTESPETYWQTTGFLN